MVIDSFNFSIKYENRSQHVVPCSVSCVHSENIKEVNGLKMNNYLLNSTVIDLTDVALQSQEYLCLREIESLCFVRLAFRKGQVRANFLMCPCWECP